MKKFKDSYFLDRLILRIPLFSFEKAKYDSNLKKNLSDPKFIESIYLASPSLYSSFLKWINDENEEHSNQKLIESLVKYHIRMCTRATPFGLFAGCTTVGFGSINDVRYSGNFNKEIRIDLNVLSRLTNELNLDSEIRNELLYYLNTSLYKVGESYRYVETYYDNRNSKKFRLCSVYWSPYLEAIIKMAENGARIQQLVDLLASMKIDQNDAINFVNELINSQILISSLQPTIVGEDLFKDIFSKISHLKLSKENSIFSTLIRLYESFEKIKFSKIDSINKYEEFISQLTEKVKKEDEIIFQVNSFPILRGSPTIESDIKNRLLRVLELLCKVNRFNYKTRLDIFREKFFERYEYEEVPLVDALDTEFGIEYIDKSIGKYVNPIISDLQIQKHSSESKIRVWDDIDSFLLERIIIAQNNNQREIKLEESDFTITHKDSDFELPESMCVFFSMLCDSEQGAKILFRHASGPSAAMLLGRFTTGNDEIFSIVKDIAAHENNVNAGKAVAEIVHLCEDRTGNILTRKKIRDFEIPYLCSSQLRKDQIFEVRDILISVRNDKLVLRSRKSDIEIVPKLSNAHNYSSKAVPIYHFLCDFQNQNKIPFVMFNWGAINMGFKFLPRVTIEGVIVSPAIWKLDKNDFIDFLPGNSDENGECILRWIAKFHLDEKFFLMEGDDHLYVDTNDTYSLKVFFSIVKKKKFIKIEEFLYSNKLVVNDEKNMGYFNEFIAVLMNNPKENKANNVNHIDTKNVDRKFAIGSEWIYYKIYCGEKVAEDILINTILPIINKIRRENYLKKWFFVRYSDSSHHLRIRINVNNRDNIGSIIKLLESGIKPYFDCGKVSKVQADTYIREIERYDPNGIEIAETIFSLDSETVIEILVHLSKNHRDEMREIVAFYLVDSYLEYIGFGLDKKLEFVKQQKSGFYQEFGYNNDLKIQINKKYNFYKKEIDRVLQRDPIYDTLRMLVDEKLGSLIDIFKQLKALNERRVIINDIDDLLSSYIHMSVNRLFVCDQRLIEFITYEFLFKHYTSIRAKM